MAKGRPRKTQGGDVLLRSAELIGWALGGLEREIVETRQRLEGLTRQAAQLRSRIGSSGTKGRGPAAAATFDEPAVKQHAPARKKRQMSAAARKRISEMQKKRWAEWRKKKGAAEK
jgi:sensor domain CHASE-containing protein